MNERSLLGRLTASIWQIGLGLAALQALVCGCVASSEEQVDPAEEVSLAVNPTPVSQHGALHVDGNRIKDAHGDVVQLRGMSLFWSQWGQTGGPGNEYYKASVVNSLVDSWNVSLVRAALGVEPDGYLANPTAEENRVRTVVNAAVAKGVYVIIDWHDHNAHQHTQQARDFFTRMARDYKNTPNVIFEIFNEPLDYHSWSQVKTYAEDVIGAIRGQGANNLVVVGTPTWSQDVDVAANNPITQYGNIAYTLHFYAGSHKQALRNKATTALNRGIALFVTEWGTTHASGNTGLDLAESQAWINFMDANKLSWANWSLNRKNETAAALLPHANTTGPWVSSELSPSGTFVKQKLLDATQDPGDDDDDPPPSPSFQFSVSSSINPWWIQVNVANSGQTITGVTAKVGSATYPLTLQSWGDWTISPPSAVPAGTQVIFTATSSNGAVGTFTSAPWPG
ncbi:glycoside hydrolase family 5 protein [Chondromyces apiculatus]|uniref:Endo-1,4-beta-xylanase A n=1 Tax=Chondromyces apiculatus DSM 436 TaxID=1192034 RepID=A0A017T799_9BACT|nr:glycoside hydrolase family 5 protein [Chondromyces apiculatus]EYF05123.1 Endo-1,4-beta-xylanase A precursor [Chondromyces apiculatus DSM 436]